MLHAWLSHSNASRGGGGGGGGARGKGGGGRRRREEERATLSAANQLLRGADIPARQHL